MEGQCKEAILKNILIDLLFVISLVAGCVSASQAAVLVMSPNGTYISKPDLAATAVAADAAGKKVVVTTPQTLTANIVWPSDRTLKFEPGGYIILNGYTLTGLKDARPENFEAIAGINDSTAFQAALNSATHLILTPGLTYFLSSGVNVANSGTIIDFNGATVVGSTGISVFTVSGTTTGVKFHNGVITSKGNNLYAVGIQVEGNGFKVNDSGPSDLTVENMQFPSGTTGIQFYKRFDRGYISNTTIFTNNGIIINGKVADVYISNCIIAGKRVAGTFGIRTQNPTGAGTNYPEGLRVVNTTITNYATCVSMDDIFVASFINCWIQPFNTGGVINTNVSVRIALNRGTAFAKYIQFANCSMLDGPFIVSESGYNAEYAKYVQISNCQFLETYVQVDANNRFISMDNTLFKSYPPMTAAMTIANNADNITYSNITVSGQYANGVVINGTTGTNIVLKDFTWEYAGYPAITKLTTTRPILARNVDPAYEHQGAIISAGTTTAGSVLKTLTFHVGAGQKFIINLALDYTIAGADTLSFAFCSNLLVSPGSIVQQVLTLPVVNGNHIEHQIIGTSQKDMDCTITVTNGPVNIAVNGGNSYLSATAL
jgi:hypothetical protein